MLWTATSSAGVLPVSWGHSDATTKLDLQQPEIHLRQPSLAIIRKSMLDPNAAYQIYQAEPSQQNLRVVVDSLAPTIDYSLSSLNSGNDPHMRNMAKVHAARAIKKFDPQYGASIKTWVSNQMQPLKRLRRQTQQVLKIPERIQLDGWQMAQASQEFVDLHDREPDIGELSEMSKLPVKRIGQIRSYNRRMGVDSEDKNSPMQTQTSFDAEALGYVFDESDHIDRMIIQGRMGYQGSPIVRGSVLTKQLKLSPSQFSRRSSRISLKLLKISDDLEATMT